MSSLAQTDGAPFGGRQPPRPSFINWLIPGILALIGFMLVIVGSGILVWTNPEFIAQGVQQGTIQSDVFSRADLVSIATVTMGWTGSGLILAGVASWLGAIGYNRARSREIQMSESSGTPHRSVVTSSLTGAVGSIIFSFIPFSPVIGGAIAGYLQNGGTDANLRAGGLSGLLVAIPIVIILLAVFGGMTVGAAAANAFEAMVFVTSLLVGGILVAVLGSYLLGAVGGYFGGRYAEYVARNA